MQKTQPYGNGCPKDGRTESESIWGAQTFMWISEKSLVAVQPSLENLLELILSPKNLNQACLQVKRNGGAGGVLALASDRRSSGPDGCGGASTISASPP